MSSEPSTSGYFTLVLFCILESLLDTWTDSSKDILQAAMWKRHASCRRSPFEEVGRDTWTTQQAFEVTEARSRALAEARVVGKVLRAHA